MLMGRRANDLSGIAVIAVHCENCGRRKRLGPDRIRTFSQAGIRSVESLGERMVCVACRESGRADRNVSLIPYARSEFQARRA